MLLRPISPRCSRNALVLVVLVRDSVDFYDTSNFELSEFERIQEGLVLVACEIHRAGVVNIHQNFFELTRKPGALGLQYSFLSHWGESILANGRIMG
jgi:hypothetical protein